MSLGGCHLLGAAGQSRLLPCTSDSIVRTPGHGPRLGPDRKAEGEVARLCRALRIGYEVEHFPLVMETHTLPEARAASSFCWLCRTFATSATSA